MVDNLVGFTTFYSDASKHGEKYVALEDEPKATIETLVLILILVGLV